MNGLFSLLQDTKNFARSFQQETPIKRGQVNNQDRDLLDRIIAQVDFNFSGYEYHTMHCSEIKINFNMNSKTTL